jgi:hypothetical protein
MILKEEYITTFDILFNDECPHILHQNHQPCDTIITLPFLFFSKKIYAKHFSENHAHLE